MTSRVTAEAEVGDRLCACVEQLATRSTGAAEVGFHELSVMSAAGS